MKIITVFPSFAHKGGAEDMAISIAKGLNGSSKSVILHSDNSVHTPYVQEDLQYEKFNFKNILKYHKEGAIFLSHHRKSTTLLILFSRIFLFNRLQVVHVAHNTFSSLKYFTLFPKYNIAVSKTVKDNMLSYFGLKENEVTVIYNGIEDQIERKNSNTQKKNSEKIKILFLGRINPVKRQVEFVKATKDKIDKNIIIYFGGEGEDMEMLRKVIANDPQYVTLGLINITEQLDKYDYVCLFSEKEGLPLSLIQGQMFGKPLITNNIPQVLEINKDKFCGFVNSSWSEIIDCINSLPLPSSEEYHRLSNNSRSVFEDKFNFTTMIDHYKTFLNLIKWRE